MILKSIQYLRAVAAILVVYRHSIDSQMDMGVSKQQNFRFLQNFGAIGVDIFFIISGFIIAQTSLKMNGKRDGLYFLAKRVLRINPSYYIATAISIIIFYLTTPTYVVPVYNIIRTIIILPVFNKNSLYVYPILVIGWTLAFEWIFYLMFASLLFLKLKRKMVAIISLIFILLMLGFLPNKSVLLQFLTNPILSEFAMGVLLAIMYNKCSINNRLTVTLFIAGISGYLLLIYFGYSDVSEVGNTLSGKSSWLRVLLWGIPSFMLVTGTLFLEKNGIWAYKNSICLLLGNASFAIYLIHPISIYLLSLYMTRHAVSSYVPPDAIVFILFSFSVIMGVLFYLIIEKRLSKSFAAFLHRMRKEPLLQ